MLFMCTAHAFYALLNPSSPYPETLLHPIAVIRRWAIQCTRFGLFGGILRAAVNFIPFSHKLKGRPVHLSFGNTTLNSFLSPLYARDNDIYIYIYNMARDCSMRHPNVSVSRIICCVLYNKPCC